LFHQSQIANTCGWVEKEGFELLVYAIKCFKADVVLVIDNERLYTDLRDKEFYNAATTVEFVKLKKSGGVLVRDRVKRAEDRQLSIREYFYGARGEMHPHHLVVATNVLRVCKVGGGPQAPDTALPLGAERTIDVTLAGGINPIVM
jgi:polyribonucleotide 5'-hydroxyl-kinase